MSRHTRARGSRYTLRYERGAKPGEQTNRPSIQLLTRFVRQRDSRLTQHAAFTLRTHVDQWHAGGTFEEIARAWMDVADAPLGEASIVRLFGAAQALADVPAGLAGSINVRGNVRGVRMNRLTFAPPDLWLGPHSPSDHFDQD